MLFSIPGVGELELKDLLLDFNGTIARDGQLISNLDRTLLQLAEQLMIHIITADTGGTVQQELSRIPCRLHIIKPGDEARQKVEYLRSIGSEHAICFGNGANDSLMLKEAKVGVAVLEGEGAATAAIINSDIVCRSIFDAFGLLMVPQRMVATLRK